MSDATTVCRSFYSLRLLVAGGIAPSCFALPHTNNAVAQQQQLMVLDTDITDLGTTFLAVTLARSHQRTNCVAVLCLYCSLHIPTVWQFFVALVAGRHTRFIRLQNPPPQCYRDTRCMNV